MYNPSDHNRGTEGPQHTPSEDQVHAELIERGLQRDAHALILLVVRYVRVVPAPGTDQLEQAHSTLALQPQP